MAEPDDYKAQVSIKLVNGKPEIMVNLRDGDSTEDAKLNARVLEWYERLKVYPKTIGAPVDNLSPAGLQRAIDSVDPFEDTSCPDCDGPVWDNRASKLKPNQPDFKCKDKTCGCAGWIKDTGQVSWARGGRGAYGAR